MTELRALIVDDERLARRELRALLAAHPQVKVIGEAQDLDEAVQLLTRENPDVVFLDIQLGAQSGFDLFSRIEVAIPVVFVTAHDAHALRAFDVNALDYLLKPVSAARLAASIERLSDQRSQEEEPRRRFEIGDFVFLPIEGKGRFLRVNQIVSITANGDYTELAMTDGSRIRVLKALRTWEERLPEEQFARIHRESIVNLQFVERIEAWSHEAYHVHVRGRGEPLVLSRRYATRLKDRFT